MVEDDDSLFAALQAGARGSLLKGTRKDDIVRTVRGVAAGEAIFGPAIAKRLTRYFEKPRTSTPTQAFLELPRARSADSPAHGRALHQPEDRRTAPHHTEDPPQQRAQHIHPAASRRPSPSHHRRAPGQAGLSQPGQPRGPGRAETSITPNAQGVSHCA
jgi:hypothetical protein